MRRLLLLGLVLGAADALRVANGSPCESLCGNVLDATTKDDLVCKEGSYAASSAGIVFQRCVTCELSSSYSTRLQSDVQWLLYNLRYAVSYCLFGFPENPTLESNPCIIGPACEPLKRSIEYDSLAPNTTSYGYCSLWDTGVVPKCSACLRAGRYFYLDNFISVLDAGCQQQPVAGSTVSVEGRLFSSDKVNATEPTPTATALPNYDSGPLSLGAKVGVAIGGVLLVLAAAGFCVVCRGKRKRRSFLRRLETRQQAARKAGGAGWPTPLNTASTHGETPLSQRPLRSWDDSPMSSHTDRTFPRYFSPYGSQYGSPVSAADAPMAQAWPVPEKPLISPLSPQAPTHEIGLAIGSHGSRGDGDAGGIGGGGGSGRWDEADLHAMKGKEKEEWSDESYEMRHVDGQQTVVPSYPPFPRGPSPPVLHEPGFGGVSESSRYYRGLTEEDARRGHAL